MSETKTRNEYHVVPNPNGGWTIHQTGNDDNLGRFDLKEEAVSRAREVARSGQAELVIHDEEGRIQSKDSYGNDPRDVKG